MKHRKQNDPGHRVREIFVFVAIDEDDDEGVPAFRLGDGTMLPLIGSDRARIDSLRGMAQAMADHSGSRFVLRRFSVAEDLEELAPVTWTCHVCGAERADALISVFKHHRTAANGVEFDENVRYCNDRPACAEGAKSFSHLRPRGNG